MPKLEQAASRTSPLPSLSELTSFTHPTIDRTHCLGSSSHSHSLPPSQSSHVTPHPLPPSIPTPLFLFVYTSAFFCSASLHLKTVTWSSLETVSSDLRRRQLFLRFSFHPKILNLSRVLPLFLLTSFHLHLHCFFWPLCLPPCHNHILQYQH